MDMSKRDEQKSVANHDDDDDISFFAENNTLFFLNLLGFEKEAQQIADCAATLGSQAVWRVTFPEACEPVIPRMTYERRTDALVTNGEERTKTTYRLPARSTIAALQPDFKRINDDHENVTKGRSVARLVVTPISGICMAAVLEANTNIPANIIRSVRGRTSRARPRQ